MERELFEWDGWDQHNILTFQFYDIKLLKPIGAFLPGNTFDSALVCYEKGILELYDEDGPVKNGKFKLTLSVGDCISE